MTPDNEPSVAERIAYVLKHNEGFQGGLLIGRELLELALIEVTRLERRCAEMEKTLRKMHSYDDLAELLPPERANEGKIGG